MKKIAMMVALITMLATSANAGMGTWQWVGSGNTQTLQWCGGCWNSTYIYTPYELLQKYSN